MPKVSILDWRDGEGWLVLSGGGNFQADETVDIDAEVLSRTISHGPLALIWSATDIETADHYIDYLQDLGSRTGFLLDITGESHLTIQEQLDEAGIIVLMQGNEWERVLSTLRDPFIRELLEKAFHRGATIYAQGHLAATFAAWILTPMGIQQGLDWLNNALIPVPIGNSEGLKTGLQSSLPAAYGVSIETGSALALSSTGEIEIWGKAGVSIILGKDISSA
jgi:hypothetical protein